MLDTLRPESTRSDYLVPSLRNLVLFAWRQRSERLTANCQIQSIEDNEYRCVSGNVRVGETNDQTENGVAEEAGAQLVFSVDV
jgi:hypothetical protein